MAENTINRKQSETQTNLYRLLRLQNRENNFIFKDLENGQDFFMRIVPQNDSFPWLQMRVSYQHFPLDTIAPPDLLKTLWKFITTHYFKKIDEEELYRLNYIRNLLTHPASPLPPRSLRQLSLPQAFYRHLATLFEPFYLQQIYDNFQDSLQGRIFIKQLLVAWGEDQVRGPKKTKKIVKIREQSRMGRGRGKELRVREEELDQLIVELSDNREQNLQTERDNIDEEIARLERLQQRNSLQNLELVYQVQARILDEEEENERTQVDTISGRDAECLQWLIHNLQEKQIAESVAKIAACQRKEGETKFQIHYERALNLEPELLSERPLKKLNQLRETSLLKFYRTGAKSTRSFICHNFAGFTETEGGQKSRGEKDYLQMMKKIGNPSVGAKKTMEQFDMCHHCKFLYQPQFLLSCRFSSDRQCMPKINQTETDFANDLTLQKGRVSQRFVAKHRNCMTGYARVGEEYVCGRKFCLSCLKDNYGQNWMKTNYGLCPFCQGVCSCTRCLRNQKMNKLKAFFITLGGDISTLQTNSLIDRLPVRKDEAPKMKGRSKMIKTKKIWKEEKPKYFMKELGKYIPKSGRRALEVLEKKSVGSEDMEKWSSTAEKEVQKSVRWRGTRRARSRLY